MTHHAPTANTTSLRLPTDEDAWHQSIIGQRLRTTYTEIVAFCHRWGITELALFGSVLREDFRPDSDIDVLVVFNAERPRRAFHRIQAQSELEALVGRSVDLTEKVLLSNPVSRQEIVQTHHIIYPNPSGLFDITPQSMSDQEHLRNQAAIADMVQAIQEIQEDIGGLSYEDYQVQRVVRRAVERNCEIIGEAARRISPSFRADHPDIDWKGAVGLRNVIIHRYDQVNDQEVWAIASSILPPLLEQLQLLSA